MTKAQEFLKQANQAREDGNFVEALELLVQAIVGFQQEGNPGGIAEALASQFLTYRHLFYQTNDQNYLIIAVHSALAGVDIVSKGDQPDRAAIPLFNAGKAYEELGQFTNAINAYKAAIKAMEQNPPQQHNRPAVIADMKAHLAAVELEAGDTSARNRLEQAITELEQADEKQYEKDVWLSGAHLRYASILPKDNPHVEEHLQKAKEIIDANPDLKLRKQQWEKLAKKLKV